MSGLFEILEKVKAKPGMYIGQASITNLFMFLAGYKTALREVGSSPTEQEMEFQREFQPWIQKRFQLLSVNSWAKIILLYSVDEKEAFYYFFSLLEEFLQRDKSLEFDKVKPAAREVTVSTYSSAPPH